MANELIFSSTSTARVPIAVASICGVRKVDHVDPSTGVTDYRLVFTMPTAANIVWSFTTALARNADFTNLITQYGFDIG